VEGGLVASTPWEAAVAAAGKGGQPPEAVASMAEEDRKKLCDGGHF
jgi:hypothetical protein